MPTSSDQVGHPGRRNDLFVVHASGDRAWVDGYLKPMLGVEPDRVITPGNFDPTGTLVDEFVRSTQSSRFTALVLSPAFLADDWAAFGQQLATFAAVEEGHSRFVVLTRHECELPLQLRYRVSLDCTNWEEWDDQIAKLRKLLEAPDPILAEIPCPYPGMIPFRAEDARFFFGRENEVNDLLARLRHHHILFVIGSSGSGKSSLVTAGLLPRLGDSKNFPKGTWKVVTMRPGSSPSEELARLFGGPPDDPLASIDPLLGAAPAGQKLLLVVDQFEELFTQTKEHAEQDRFLGRLNALRDEPRCAVIATMRADFYGDLMNSALWPVDDSQQMKISAPRGDALRAAIVRPSEAVGVFLEDGLVERLLADAADEPGVLPMLQEALALLWGQRKGRLLARPAYDALGREGRSGMAVAMATKADATLAQLPNDQQKIARRIFLRLVQFGEGRPDTRRQLPVDELRAKGDDPAIFERVLSSLIENRLLIPSQDEARGRRVDISHEMLIVGWPASQEWAKVRRAAELTRRWLVGEAESWTRRGRGESGLLDEGQVSEAERWLSGPDASDLGVDEDIQALVDASGEAIRREKEAKEAGARRELEQARDLAEERGRRVHVFRAALAGAGVLSAVLAVLSGYAVYQRGQAQANAAIASRNERTALKNEKQAIENAERARLEERAAQAQGLAFRAIPFLIDESREPQEALGYSLAAVRASRPVGQPAVTALYNSVQDNHLAALLPKHELGVEAFSWSPSGDHIATIDRRGRLRLWTPRGAQVGAEQELGVLLTNGNSGLRRPLAWSSDGKVLVAGSGDRAQLRWIKVAEGTPPRVIEFPKRVASLGWSHDGQNLAVLSEGGPGPPVAAGGVLPRPRLQLFDRDGNWSGSPLSIFVDVDGFAWNPVTSMLATFGGRGGAILLGQPGGGINDVLGGHGSPVSRVSWAPDGEALASVDRGNNIYFWERGVAAGPPLALGDKPLMAWAWSLDGQALAFSAGYDGKIPRIWSRKTRDATPEPTPERPSLDFGPKVLPGTKIHEISWSPNGLQLATLHGDQYALWTPAGKFISAQLGRSIHWHPRTGAALTSPLMPSVPNSVAKPDPTLRHLNASGREISSFRGHETVPVRVAWNADGSLAASAGSAPEEDVRIWDPTEDPMKTLDAPAVRPEEHGWNGSLAWQPGGRTLVLANAGRFHLRDGEGTPLSILDRDRAGMEMGTSGYECRWSPDGRRFLFQPSRFGEQRVILFDPSGEIVATMAATEPSWNPVEPTLVTLESGRVQVRNLDGKVTHEARSEGTRLLAWSPDGSTLASLGVDPPKILPAHPAPSTPPAPPAGPRTLPTIRLTFWSNDLSRKVEVTATGYAINRLLWSPDGRTLAATDDATALWLWSPDGRAIRRIGLPHDGIGPLAWSPDGAYLATVTGGATTSSLYNPGRAPQRLDALILMWDRRGEPVPSFVGTGHDKAVFFIGWSPIREGNVLATAGAGRTVRLWTPKGEIAGESPLRGHDGPVYQVRWAPDGRRFATISTDRTIRIWDLRIEKGEVQAAPIMTLAGPENRLPIVPSVRYVVQVAAAPTHPSPQTADPRIEVVPAPPDYLLAWRPDGLGIASVTGDPFVRLWTTELAEIYALGRRRLITRDAREKSEAVAPVWDPLAPEDVARNLASDDPWTRARAAHLFGRLGAEAAPSLDRLRWRLGDPDPRVREAVSWALSRVARATDAASMEALARRIGEETSWSVRLAAIHGLSTATGERPPTLLGALASAVGDERLRPYATRVLRSSGKLALAALTPGVKSGDPDLAFGSLRVLDTIARSQPTDAGLGEVPPELIQAQEAAGAGGDDRRKAAAVAVRISLLGRKAAEVEPIRELLASKDERARILALDLASQVGEGRKALIPSVAKAIMDDSTTTRNRALGLLAAIGESIPAGPGVSPPSSPTPLTYRDDLQAKAIESIGPELGPLVVEILLKVPYYATQWIGHLNDQLKASIVDELLPRLEGDASSLPLDALAGLSKSFASRVEPLLKSNRVEDRRSAVALAARLGKLLSSLKPQVEPLLKDDDPQTRVGAALALWKIDSQSAPKTLEVLRAALEHTDAAIRNLAIQGLGSMGRGAESGVEVLIKLVKDDPDPSVRDAARDAASSIRAILSHPPTLPSKIPAP